MEPGHNPSPYPLHKCPLDPWESLSNLPIKELVQQLVLLLTTLTLSVAPLFTTQCDG